MTSHRWAVLLPVFFLLLLALVGAARPSVAQQPEPGPWMQTAGPAGGVMSCIEMHPVNPDILFAGGAGGCLWKSTNGGALWQKLPPMHAPSSAIRYLSHQNHGLPAVLVLLRVVLGRITWAGISCCEVPGIPPCGT
jgi:photosystem II stability/assembly factor-like uncharacterized protein